MRFALVPAALAALCIAAPAAHAQMARPFTHEALFIKVDAGIGYLQTKADFADTSAEFYGGAGYLGFSIGGAVSSNLVIYGELWGMAAASPTGKFGGITVQANRNITLNYSGLGVGIGTFVMPANVFLGFSVDATRLGITNHDNGDQSNSDIGGALTLTLGKQFWLSPRLGLGVEVKGIAGTNKHNNNDNNSANYTTLTGMGLVALTFG
jgi:hypothetical protein